VIRAILFDLDDTLVDRQACVRHCIADQFERFTGQLGAISKTAFVELFLKLDQRGYIERPAVYGAMARELGFSPALADPLTEDYFATYARFPVGVPHLIETLTDLRGGAFKMAIVTNGRPALQGPIIQSLGIGDYFHSIVISKVEGFAKPDSRIFQLTLDRLGVAAQHAVFVGNHPVEDIQGAQQAGLRTIWKRDDFFGPCPHADHVIDELSELKHLLDRLTSSRPATSPSPT
jgi:putative hydrolase of the HAD superfamily